MFPKLIVISYLAAGILVDAFAVTTHKPEVTEANIDAYFTCIGNTINWDILKYAIPQARANGSLYDVFKNVCEKSQQLKSCWHTFAYKEIPEGGTDPVFLNYKRGGERTVDFICHKNGERIVSFINENGLECVEQHAVEINDCGTRLRSIENVHSDNNVEEKCAAMYEFSTCLSNAMKCEKIIPGLLVDFAMQTALAGLPCQTPRK